MPTLEDDIAENAERDAEADANSFSALWQATMAPSQPEYAPYYAVADSDSQWQSALATGDVEQLRSVLDTVVGGAEEHASFLNQRDQFGYSPWLYATVKGATASLRWLSQQPHVNPADVALVDETMRDQTAQGWGALHLAAAYGHFEALCFLLKLRPDLTESRSATGCTPLIIASMYGEILCVRLLLHHGADMHAVDNLGDSALHWSAYKDHVSVVQLLTSQARGIDMMDRSDSFGQTALHLAAQRGSQHATAALVELGADTSNRDLQGKRPVDLTYAKLKLKNPMLEHGQTQVTLLLDSTLFRRIQREIGGVDWPFYFVFVCLLVCLPGYLRCLQVQLHEVSLHLFFWFTQVVMNVSHLATHFIDPGTVGLKELKIYEEECVYDFQAPIVSSCILGVPRCISLVRPKRL
eukprot:COSAG05_NODE_5_length_47078_cov_547.868814_2_plen_410_part_00